MNLIRSVITHVKTIVIIGTVGLLANQVVYASVIDAHWLGGNGNWNDASKWSSGVIPNNAGNDIYNAIIDGGIGAPANVTLDGDVSLASLALGAGQQLTVSNSQSLTVDGSFVSDGTISASSSSTFTIRATDGILLSDRGILFMDSGLGFSSVFGSVSLVTTGRGTIGEDDLQFGLPLGGALFNEAFLAASITQVICACFTLVAAPPFTTVITVDPVFVPIAFTVPEPDERWLLGLGLLGLGWTHRKRV